jgi:hypothetical protein
MPAVQFGRLRVPGFFGRRVQHALFLLVGLCAAIFVAPLVFTPSSALSAQTAGSGGLTVGVTDPSGATIAGATITVTNSAGTSRTGTSGADGTFTFTLLSPGNYNVTITAQGFQTMNVQAVPVNVAETHTLNEALQIGAVQQQVTVSSNVQTVQTETSALGTVVSSQAVVDLPLVTRNYTQILGLSPGVVADVYNATALGRGSAPTYVNGADNISNTYQQDGTAISNYASSAPQDPANFYGSIPIPNPDAIQEFKVQTSQYDAGFGRNAGGNVDVVTKSGTNSIHGSVFEFLRNDDLNANTFFSNELHVPRGKLEQNQFGVAAGGPAVKDKLFWFASYQGTRQINGVAAQGSSTVTLPSQLTNTRTAAALGAEFCGQATFGGGVQVACDGSNINPVALNILNAKLSNGLYYIPSPTSGSLAGFSIPARFNENQELLNLDWDVSAKNKVALRYFYSIAPQTQAFANAGGQPAGGGITALSGNQLFMGRLTTILTNNLVNEARWSSYYIRASINSNDPITASSVGTQTAASYFNLIPVINFSLAGYSNVGGSTVDVAKPPQLFYEWADQVSWVHGKHAVRAGYDEQRVHWQQVVPSFNRGTLYFRTFSDFLLGMSAAQNGSALSNIYESTATIEEPNPGTINQNRENNLSLFLQDDYKVSQRLTLNMGLRWDYLGTAYDSLSPLNGATNPVYALDSLVPIPPAGGTLSGYTVANNYAGTLPAGVLRRNVNLLTNGLQPLNNLGPRIGFAWQPLSNGKAVVRGGYGLFYNLMMGNTFEIELNNNPPSSAPLTYIGAANALANWANPYNPLPSLGFGGFVRTTTTSLSQSGLDPNILTPYTESYNLNVQYAIKPSWFVQLGYSGSHSVHIETGRALNEATLASVAAPVNCGAPSGCITTDTSANAPMRVPVLGIRPGGFSSAGNWGYGKYNSLQAILRKTLSNGMQFQAAYTYGRDFTNVVGVNLQGGVAGSVNSNDPNVPREAYGPADFNRQQRFIMSYLYSLPNYHDANSVAGKLLSGWGLSGVTTVQDGLPVTFIDSLGGGAYGGFETASARAELCPGAKYSGAITPGDTYHRIVGTNVRYFSPAIFCGLPLVAGGGTGAYDWGNSARGALLGPGQFNWDLSITKETKVPGFGEPATLQFRTEFFNAFNHPQFMNPGVLTVSNGVAPASGTFGKITATAVGPRILLFALKYNF